MPTAGMRQPMSHTPDRPYFLTARNCWWNTVKTITPRVWFTPSWSGSAGETPKDRNSPPPLLGSFNSKSLIWPDQEPLCCDDSAPSYEERYFNAYFTLLEFPTELNSLFFLMLIIKILNYEVVASCWPGKWSQRKQTVIVRVGMGGGESDEVDVNGRGYITRPQKNNLFQAKSFWRLKETTKRGGIG